jgi:trk system potassium uptake protein TrkH
MTLIMFVLLLCGHMSVFEALCTALGTAGTGGFGVLNDSMASYSPYIQWVVTAFMLLFSVNFSCYYLLLLGRIKDVFNAELRSFIAVVGTVMLVVTLNTRGLFDSLGEAIRHVAFTVASLISTTGFATENFDAWPELSRTLLVLIMFIGACAGSTAGGIKISRFIIAIKTVIRDIRKMLHPRSVSGVQFEDKKVDDKTINSVSLYFTFYFIIFILLFILLSFEPFDFETNFTAVSACFNNIGPGLAGVGPMSSFAGYSDAATVLLTFAMLLGRLEIFPILLLFTPAMWKKK